MACNLEKRIKSRASQVNTQLSDYLNMRFLHLASQTQLQPFVCLQKPLAR